MTAPPDAGLILPARFDLDSLNREQIRLGPNVGDDLHLPDRPDQPTPRATLIAQLDADDQPGLSLIPELTDFETEPVQVNAMPVSHQWSLRDGDVITLGAYRFKYENLRQRRRQ